jgi:hypothetical protein
MTRIKVIKPYWVVGKQKKKKLKTIKKKPKQLKDIIKEAELDMQLGKRIATPFIYSGKKIFSLAKIFNPKKVLEKTVAAVPAKKTKGVKYVVRGDYSQQRFKGYGSEKSSPSQTLTKEYQTTEDMVKSVLQSEQVGKVMEEMLPTQKTVREMLDERQHKPIGKQVTDFYKAIREKIRYMGR